MMTMRDALFELLDKPVSIRVASAGYDGVLKRVETEHVVVHGHNAGYLGASEVDISIKIAAIEVFAARNGESPNAV